MVERGALAVTQRARKLLAEGGDPLGRARAKRREARRRALREWQVELLRLGELRRAVVRAEQPLEVGVGRVGGELGKFGRVHEAKRETLELVRLADRRQLELLVDE